MNSLRRFEEFVSDGTIKKQRRDLPRSASLVEEAEKRKAFLKEIAGKLGLSDEMRTIMLKQPMT
ncbi:hypothetical protein HYU40_05005 [Candidatus Woesearchaeota archaeon]|nr:hypothetical protein [Candidatus Woesearchaeota archaeon]